MSRREEHLKRVGEDREAGLLGLLEAQDKKERKEDEREG